MMPSGQLDAWCLGLIVINFVLLLGLILGWDKLIDANRDLIAAQTHQENTAAVQEQTEHAQGLNSVLVDITLTLRGKDERP